MIIFLKKKSRLVSTQILLILVFSLSLFSCGGGGSVVTVPNSKVPPVDANKGGFQSISNPVFNSVENIQSAIHAAGGQNITAQYSVNTYRLEYMTLDSANALVKVSGLIAIPEKDTLSPMVSYQHATTFTNASAPSFQLTASEQSLEIALASLGYIVFASDYIGYGTSFGRLHPYLQKQPSANVVNDLLQAVKPWLDLNNIKVNSQLFMAGYSQGGYVTMAALQDLQNNPRDGFQATAALMGAGPYDVNTALNTLLLGINIPDGLVNTAINLLERFIIPANTEVRFERTFLERFFADDRQDDVHNWRPDIPIKLFHGNDDNTVPIESAESTFASMTNLGADIELIRCTETPADHRNCIVPYINLVVDYFGQLRNDSGVNNK